MRIRCPACKSIHDDPPQTFVCSGCGRSLAWRPQPHLLKPEQGTLFTPSGTAENLTLDLEPAQPVGREDRSPKAASSPAREDPLPYTEESRDRTPGLVQAIALVTTMLPGGDSDPDLITAVLDDPTPDGILDMGITACWLTAALIRHVDAGHDGEGTAWLQALAALVAGARE